MSLVDRPLPSFVLLLLYSSMPPPTLHHLLLPHPFISSPLQPITPPPSSPLLLCLRPSYYHCLPPQESTISACFNSLCSVRATSTTTTITLSPHLPIFGHLPPSQPHIYLFLCFFATDSCNNPTSLSLAHVHVKMVGCWTTS